MEGGKKEKVQNTGGRGGGDLIFVVETHADYLTIKIELFDFIFVTPLREYAHGVSNRRGVVFFKSLCVCVCVRARARVRACVFVYVLTVVCVCVET